MTAKGLKINEHIFIKEEFPSQLAVSSLAASQPMEIRIAEMERQLDSQAIKLAQLERKLHEEKVSKANLEIDFEHALKQLRTMSYAC